VAVCRGRAGEVIWNSEKLVEGRTRFRSFGPGLGVGAWFLLFLAAGIIGLAAYKFYGWTSWRPFLTLMALTALLGFLLDLSRARPCTFHITPKFLIIQEGKLNQNAFARAEIEGVFIKNSRGRIVVSSWSIAPLANETTFEQAAEVATDFSVFDPGFIAGLRRTLRPSGLYTVGMRHLGEDIPLSLELASAHAMSLYQALEWELQKLSRQPIP